MRIRKERNIMGEELPMEVVRSATDVQTLYEFAVTDASEFAAGVVSTIEWFVRQGAKAPFNVK